MSDKSDPLQLQIARALRHFDKPILNSWSEASEHTRSRYIGMAGAVLERLERPAVRRQILEHLERRVR